MLLWPWCIFRFHMQWTHTHAHTHSVCTHASAFTHTPPHSCRRRCSASSEAACRSDRWRTTSSGPECPWSPRSCRAVPGNHPPYPRPRPLWSNGDTHSCGWEDDIKNKPRKRHAVVLYDSIWQGHKGSTSNEAHPTVRCLQRANPESYEHLCKHDLFGVLWADQQETAWLYFAQVYTFLKWICFYGS